MKQKATLASGDAVIEKRKDPHIALRSKRGSVDLIHTCPELSRPGTPNAQANGYIAWRLWRRTY